MCSTKGVGLRLREHAQKFQITGLFRHVGIGHDALVEMKDKGRFDLAVRPDGWSPQTDRAPTLLLPP